MKAKIVLASASKRRSLILSSCGIAHKVYRTGVREVNDSRRSAKWNVMENAKRKALFCAEKQKGSVIIGADTLVVLGKRLIGKPRNASQAKRLLKEFSGNRLAVITGLFVINPLTGKSASGFEKSLLYAGELKAADVKRWFAALRPYDKAGGFSIEGAGSLIYDNIRGSYFNILGLPMIRLKEVFEKTGLDILDICGDSPKGDTPEHRIT